jgi:hypothetical protein
MSTKKSLAKPILVVACIGTTLGVASILLVRLNSHSQENSPHSTVQSMRTPSTEKYILPPPKANSFTSSQSSRAGANRTDWDSNFAQTKSYFEFVSQASLAALKGDGNAARNVSVALGVCLPLVRMYGNSSNPEDAFKIHWDNQAYAPQWLLNKANNEFQKCKEFLAGENVFANLPARAGGYNSTRFWADLAVADKDPIALSSQAAVAVNTSARAPSAEAKTETLDSVQLMINQVVDSSNPAAIFRIGQVLTDGRVSADPVRGFAIALAACDMGYDCSSSNAELFGACAIQGDCARNLNYADVVKKAVGEDGYARAYGQAQEFEQALARGDMSAAHRLTELSR